MVLSSAQPSLPVSPTLPLSYEHLSLCVVLAAMCFSQHLARRGREEGRGREKGAFFQQRMTDALLKEPRPFEGPAPSAPPPLCASGPLSRGVGSNPPTPPPSQALCHCKSPHRPKQTHSGKKKRINNHSPQFQLFWYGPGPGRKDCLAVTKHTGDTDGRDVWAKRDSRKEG